jgi:hypothetical protein
VCLIGDSRAGSSEGAVDVTVRPFRQEERESPSVVGLSEDITRLGMPSWSKENMEKFKKIISKNFNFSLQPPTNLVTNMKNRMPTTN